MKIGEFSERCRTTKATIRYYISIGLLMPKMSGSQMEFGRQDLQDMEYIQKFKDMRFNIREIQSLLYLFRMSNLIEPSTIEKFQNMLVQKREELELEKQEIDGSIALIEEEQKAMARRMQPVKIGNCGVPLSAVGLLCCPHCRKQLNIGNAAISGRYVFSGDLTCGCGYRAEIRGGIVYTGNTYKGEHDTPDVHRKLYHETGEEWAINAHRCQEFLLEKIGERDWSGKTILEGNINGFFFTYNFLKKLPKDCLYVIIDKYGEVLEKYKDLIETMYDDLDILYIADAGEHFPLKEKCVDLYVSLFGENEFSFYHNNTFMDCIHSMLKEDGTVLGAFQSVAWNSATAARLKAKYPEGSSNMMSMSFLKESYGKNGVLLKEKKAGEVLNTIKHHMFTEHVDGEPISLYVYSANGKNK